LLAFSHYTIEASFEQIVIYLACASSSSAIKVSRYLFTLLAADPSPLPEGAVGCRKPLDFAWSGSQRAAQAAGL